MSGYKSNHKYIIFSNGDSWLARVPYGPYKRFESWHDACFYLATQHRLKKRQIN